MKDFDYSKVRNYKLYPFLMPLAKVVVKAMYRVEYIGLENVPKEGGYVVASNHVSFFDPVIIGASGMRRVHCMGKVELFEKPLLGWLLVHLNAFPVKRGQSDKSAVEYAIDCVKQGENIGIFPEGTRAKDYKPGQGKAGVALISKATGADIIPVAIYSGGQKLSPFKTKVVVRFGEVIKYEDLGLAKGTSSELREATRKIMAKITELWEEEDCK